MLDPKITGAPLGALAMLLSALLGALLGGCGGGGQGPGPQAPESVYPGTLRSVAALPPVPGLGSSFALQQQVRAVYQEGEREFRAVLQRQGDRLLMVGLGPHGGRGFVLTQVGTEVEFESHLPVDLRFSPRFMLLDVHRVWLVGVEGASSPDGLPDGEHRAERDGEEIVERWEGGRLMERTFRRLDGAPEGLIRVTYEGGLGGERPPERVVLDNGWLGYRLELRTLSFQRIPEPEDEASSSYGPSE